MRSIWERIRHLLHRVRGRATPPRASRGESPGNQKSFTSREVSSVAARRRDLFARQLAVEPIEPRRLLAGLVASLDTTLHSPLISAFDALVESANASSLNASLSASQPQVHFRLPAISLASSSDVMVLWQCTTTDHEGATAEPPGARYCSPVGSLGDSSTGVLDGFWIDFDSFEHAVTEWNEIAGGQWSLGNLTPEQWSDRLLFFTMSDFDLHFSSSQNQSGVSTPGAGTPNTGTPNTGTPNTGTPNTGGPGVGGGNSNLPESHPSNPTGDGTGLTDADLGNSGGRGDSITNPKVSEIDARGAFPHHDGTYPTANPAWGRFTPAPSHSGSSSLDLERRSMPDLLSRSAPHATSLDSPVRRGTIGSGEESLLASRGSQGLGQERLASAVSSAARPSSETPGYFGAGAGSRRLSWSLRDTGENEVSSRFEVWRGTEATELVEHSGTSVASVAADRPVESLASLPLRRQANTPEARYGEQARGPRRSVERVAWDAVVESATASVMLARNGASHHDSEETSVASPQGWHRHLWVLAAASLSVVQLLWERGRRQPGPSMEPHDRLQESPTNATALAPRL